MKNKNELEVRSKEVIEVARGLSLNIPLTMKQVNKYSKQDKIISASTISKLFGSFKNFQKQAWPEYNHRPDFSNMTREEISSLARSLSPDNPFGQEISNEYSKQNKMPSQNFIRKLFGSFGNFQKQTWSDSK